MRCEKFLNSDDLSINCVIFSETLNEGEKKKNMTESQTL